MWIEQIFGKDIAKTQFKSYEIGFNEVEDEEPILCECGEHKAKWTLTDEFMKGWHMNLCDACLKEVEAEYKEEGTKYVVSLLKK